MKRCQRIGQGTDQYTGQRTRRSFGWTTLATASLLAFTMLALTGCWGSGSGNARAPTDEQVKEQAKERVKERAAEHAKVTPPLPAKVDATCGLSNFQAEILAQINARRAAGAVCGGKKMPVAGSLAWNAQLHHAATLHALNMATTGVYAHTGSNGLTLPQRVHAAGYDYSLLGENIDAQRTSVQAAIQSWMSSPQHCENIMRMQFHDVGVSCVSNTASQWGNYWTMELGARR